MLLLSSLPSSHGISLLWSLSDTWFILVPGTCQPCPPGSKFQGQNRFVLLVNHSQGSAEYLTCSGVQQILWMNQWHFLCLTEIYIGEERSPEGKEKRGKPKKRNKNNGKKKSKSKQAILTFLFFWLNSKLLNILWLTLPLIIYFSTKLEILFWPFVYTDSNAFFLLESRKLLALVPYKTICIICYCFSDH